MQPGSGSERMRQRRCSSSEVGQELSGNCTRTAQPLGARSSSFSICSNIYCARVSTLLIHPAPYQNIMLPCSKFVARLLQEYDLARKRRTLNISLACIQVPSMAISRYAGGPASPQPFSLHTAAATCSLKPLVCTSWLRSRAPAIHYQR